MKRIFALVCALSLALLTACGAPEPTETAPAQEAAVTFTDALGRSVSVTKAEKAAALIGSFADVWCLAGGKDTLAAAAHDTWTSFDLGLSPEVADLGAIKEPNLELLLEVGPDLVLASSKTAADVDLLPTLEKAGITVAYFDISSFQDYLDMLKICCEITGRPENYERYGVQVQAQIDAAVERAAGPGPTVLYVRATGSSCKVKGSKGNVLGDMLAALGCVNIADSDTSLLEDLSMEAIMEADPDYIFIVLQGSDPTDAQTTLERTLLSDPAWEGLTAVKEGRSYVMDNALYNLKPNARWGEAYEKLADILFPGEAG